MWCSAVAALVLVVATTSYVQRADGFTMPSSRMGAVSRASNGIGVVRNGRPLNTNPRKIDVGEESIARFGQSLVKHELLTAQDEVQLSRQYRLGVHIDAHRTKMVEQLGREVTDAEVANAMEIEEHQVSFLSERGKAAKSALVRANMRLVFHMAKYYRFRGLSYPDLVQEGTFGLMKAVDRYDPDRGFRFSTYASWWIKQSVSRAIAEKSRIVRLPVHIHDLMVSMSRAERQFAIANNRKPTADELAERLALPVQKVELLKRCGRDVNSMDENLYNNNAKAASNNEVQVKDRLQSTGSEPLQLNERNSQRQELRRAMRSLTEREAQIVEMRFGLADGNPMTLEDIGKKFNVTRERIRQIEARALSKMRHPMKAGELREIFQDDNLAQQVALAQQIYLDQEKKGTAAALMKSKAQQAQQAQQQQAQQQKQKNLELTTPN